MDKVTFATDDNVMDELCVVAHGCWVDHGPWNKSMVYGSPPRLRESDNILDGTPGVIYVPLHAFHAPCNNMYGPWYKSYGPTNTINVQYTVERFL